MYPIVHFDQRLWRSTVKNYGNENDHSFIVVKFSPFVWCEHVQVHLYRWRLLAVNLCRRRVEKHFFLRATFVGSRNRVNCHCYVNRRLIYALQLLGNFPAGRFDGLFRAMETTCVISSQDICGSRYGVSVLFAKASVARWRAVARATAYPNWILLREV